MSESNDCAMCAHMRMNRGIMFCVVHPPQRTAIFQRCFIGICGADGRLFERAAPIPELMPTDSEGGEE